jgi:DNA-binding MarR family transcriptional regulator
VTELDTAYASRIAQLVDRLARLTRELQFCSGLNPAQWEAIRFLSRANRQSRTPSGLAEFLCTTKGTASQTLIALEQKGYVSRSKGGADRRQVALELTPAGQELLQRDPILGVAEVASRLGPDIGGPLVKGLTALLHDMQVRAGVKEFGVCAECTLNCVSTEATDPTNRECGLTGETIIAVDTARLCINYKSAAE